MGQYSYFKETVLRMAVQTGVIVYLEGAMETVQVANNEIGAIAYPEDTCRNGGANYAIV